MLANDKAEFFSLSHMHVDENRTGVATSKLLYNSFSQSLWEKEQKLLFSKIMHAINAAADKQPCRKECWHSINSKPQVYTDVLTVIHTLISSAIHPAATAKQPNINAIMNHP